MKGIILFHLGAILYCLHFGFACFFNKTWPFKVIVDLLQNTLRNYRRARPNYLWGTSYKKLPFLWCLHRGKPPQTAYNTKKMSSYEITFLTSEMKHTRHGPVIKIPPPVARANVDCCIYKARNYVHSSLPR